jgi:hypothetical protein
LTLNDMLVPSYRQMLHALSGWLAKAEAQLPADRAATIMRARLAPDMFPLFTQVCFSCAQAHEGMGRLRQQPFAEAHGRLLDEGRGAGESSWSIADAQARITETLAMVDQAAADLSPLPPETPVAHSLPNGMIFDLDAGQYVRDWAIPQLYFHIMAAYAILRAEGVSLGKADFVAHMFAHLRPGTMPAPA